MVLTAAGREQNSHSITSSDADPCGGMRSVQKPSHHRCGGRRAGGDRDRDRQSRAGGTRHAAPRLTGHALRQRRALPADHRRGAGLRRPGRDHPGPRRARAGHARQDHQDHQRAVPREQRGRHRRGSGRGGPPQRHPGREADRWRTAGLLVRRHPRRRQGGLGRRAHLPGPRARTPAGRQVDRGRQGGHQAGARLLVGHPRGGQPRCVRRRTRDRLRQRRVGALRWRRVLGDPWRGRRRVLGHRRQQRLQLLRRRPELLRQGGGGRPHLAGRRRLRRRDGHRSARHRADLRAGRAVPVPQRVLGRRADGLR